MSEKYCPGCDTTKDIDEFAKNKRKKDGRQVYCRQCKKDIDARHYKENKEAQLARNRRNRQEYREWIDSIKAERGCCHCPENDPACLDFHHAQGDKEDAVGAMLSKHSRENIEKEIAKCVVLCANCHRKLHRGRFKL